MIEINPGILIVQIITFIVGLWLVWKFFIGPLTDKLEQRQDNIKKKIDSAEQMKEDVVRIKLDYEKQLAEINSKAQELINLAIKEGQKSKDELIQSAHEQTKILLQKNQTQLQEEKNRIMKEIHNEIVSLSVMIAEKIIQKSVDKEVRQKMLDDIINNMTKDTRS